MANEKKSFTGSQTRNDKASSENYTAIKNNQGEGFTGSQPRNDKVSSEKIRINKK